MPSTLQVIEVTTDHALGHVGDVLLYVWRRQTTVAGVARLKAHAAAPRARERFLLGVVEQGATLPAREVRDQLAAILKDGLGGRAVASALIFEGTGLQENLVRAAVMTLRLLARQRYPHQVFATTSAALDWLTRTAEAAGAGPFPAAEAGAALAELRRRPPGQDQ